MASEILAGLLAQGAGSIIGAGASLWAQKREQDWSAEQADINRQFQSEEADKARAWNEEMWNKQNEYNNPLAQYQRLKELGINDASIMSMMSGNGAAGNAGSVATQAAPSGSQAAGQGSVASTIGQYISDIPKAGIELASNREDWYNKKIQNEIAEETKMDMIKLAHLNVSEAGQRINKLAEESRTIEQQRLYLRLQSEAQDLNNQQYKRMMDLEYNLMKADWDFKKAQIDNLDAATALSLAQAGKIPFDIALVIAQTAYEEEATKHLGDKTLEQYLVGTLGPIVEKWLGLEGKGDSEGANKVLDWLKNSVEGGTDLSIGFNIFDASSDKQFRKEMRELASDFMSGTIDKKTYENRKTKIYNDLNNRQKKGNIKKENDKN